MARILLIGGTGTISQHTLADLVAAGHEVVLANRGEHGAPALDGIEVVRLDRRDEAALSAGLAAVRPDVVADFACYLPAEARAITRIASGRVRHLVFVSTVDAFGYPPPVLPIPDDAPVLPGLGAYALAKQACEVVFLEAHDPARLPVTIVRPTYSLGPRFVISPFSPSAAGMMARIRHGLPVIVPGDGSRRMHVSDAVDTGRMIARLCGLSAAFGRTLTVGTPGSVMRQDDYVRRIGSAVGRAPQIVHVPDAVLLADPAPDIRDGLFPKLTRFDLDFDIGAAALVPGPFPGAIDAALAAYVARIEREGALDHPPPPGFEDALARAA